MNYTLKLPFKLPGLNEYTAAQRGNRYKGACLKKQVQDTICIYIKSQLCGVKLRRVKIHYTWVEKTKRRDLDNIAFAKKFIQDALVACGILPGDGWANVIGFTDKFVIGKAWGVIVELEDLEGE